MASKKLIIGVAILLGLIATWLTVYPIGSYRYRITIAIETPEGTKTGSAVHEVNYFFVPRIAPGIGLERRFRGESVVVDLGTRGVVFSLIGNKGVDISEIFPLPKDVNSPEEKFEYYSRLKNIKEKLSQTAWPRQYPDLVYFRSLSEATSVEKILIYETFDGPYPPGRPNGPIHLEQDRFEELFGKGVKLKDITLEMTDAPITKGAVEKYLPWLNELKGGYLHRGKTSKEAPLGLHSGNFKNY